MKSFPSVLPAQSKQTDKKIKRPDDFPFSSHENCGWWAIKLFSSRFDPENAKPSRPAPRVFVVFDCALVVGLVFLRFLLSLHKLYIGDCGCSVRYFCLDHQLSLCRYPAVLCHFICLHRDTASGSSFAQCGMSPNGGHQCRSSPLTTMFGSCGRFFSEAGRRWRYLTSFLDVDFGLSRRC